MLIAEYLIIFVDMVIDFLNILVQFNTTKFFCVLFSIDLVSVLGFSWYKMSFIIVNEFLMQKSVFNMFFMNN